MEEFRKPRDAETPRMDPLARLPLFFALEGRRALVAGGTPAAAWKAELLSAAGAAVDVFSAEPCDELLQIAHKPPRGTIAIHCRTWASEDIPDVAIAVGAFDDEASAAEFAGAARAAGVPVNVIDRPAFCDFAFGSIVNRSPLVIGISTDGAAPVFAQAIRAKIEAFIPLGFADWAAAAARWRERIKSSGLPFAGRRDVWQRFTRHALEHPNDTPGDDDVDTFINEVRDQKEAVGRGTVTLVGAGPGDPELLTIRALRALQSADVILFDDLVSREILDFARREAKKMLVGKTGYAPSCRQEDINALMVNLAKSGRRVVRLKGGDPLIFARAAEEIAACRSAGIAVEVVPGISAAQGAAARLGISLTHRKLARRVQHITAHGGGDELPAEIDWASIADPTTTTVIYMPRRKLAELTATAIARGLDPSTPALAVAAATRPDQVVVEATAADIAQRIADATPGGPLLVMLGRALRDGVAESAAGVEQTATSGSQEQVNKGTR